MKTSSIIYNSILPIFGIAMLSICLFCYKNNSKLNTTQGVVIKLLTSSRWSDNGPYTVYQPLVEFTDDKGTEIQFSASTFSRPSKYSINENVPVVYSPEPPNNPKIQSSFSSWFGAILAGAFALGAFILGGFVIMSSTNRK